MGCPVSASPTAGLVVGERARRTFSTFTFQYCVRELHPPQRSGGRNTDYANQSLPPLHREPRRDLRAPPRRFTRADRGCSQIVRSALCQFPVAFGSSTGALLCPVASTLKEGVEAHKKEACRRRSCVSQSAAAWSAGRYHGSIWTRVKAWTHSPRLQSRQLSLEALSLSARAHSRGY